MRYLNRTCFWEAEVCDRLMRCDRLGGEGEGDTQETVVDAICQCDAIPILYCVIELFSLVDRRTCQHRHEKVNRHTEAHDSVNGAGMYSACVQIQMQIQIQIAFRQAQRRTIVASKHLITHLWHS